MSLHWKMAQSQLPSQPRAASSPNALRRPAFAVNSAGSRPKSGAPFPEDSGDRALSRAQDALRSNNIQPSIRENAK
jgi:hypothetical protein